METVLDKAIVAARQSREREEDFYQLFFRTDLYVPVWDLDSWREAPASLPEASTEAASSGTGPGSASRFHLAGALGEPPAGPSSAAEGPAAEEENTIVPVLIESDGTNFLMLFDTLERLSAWAQEEVDYLCLPGHAIVEMMEPEVHWILNIGTPYTKEFVSAEIKWLKESLASAGDGELAVPAGTLLLVSDPQPCPMELIRSLRGILDGNSDVRRAFLGQVQYVRKTEQLHLALALDLDSATKSSTDALKHEIMAVLRDTASDSLYLDIHTSIDRGIGRRIADAVAPFYTHTD